MNSLENKLPCFYSVAGLNYKNNTATTCPRQSDQLAILSENYLPSKIYNNELFKKHRLDLYNGVWPSGCDGCEEVESKGSGLSLRQYPRKYPKIDFLNTETGEVKFYGLKHIELRFSNACNMACLHCSKVFSSGWSKKLNNYIPDDEVVMNDLIQLTDKMHRSSDDDNYSISLSNEKVEKIIEDLCLNFPKLEFVDFSGGEVLIQNQFYKALELLKEHPNHKNMYMNFHTNFNYPDFDAEKLCNLLKHFKKTIIVISIDAGKKIYSYFRDGNWEILKQNLEKYWKAGGYKISFVQPTCTTSAYQIMDLADIFESFQELNFNDMDASIVQTPTYIDPSILMYDFGNEVLKEFSKVEDVIRKKNNLKRAKFWLNQISTYTQTAKRQYRDYNRFLVYIKKTDQLWNQNFNDFYVNWKYYDGELVYVG